jgi:hypothetical protein
VVIDTDAKDSVERLYSLKDSLTVSKRRRIDISDLQEMLKFADVSEYRHVRGISNPMDCMTKKYGKFGISKEKSSYQRLMDLIYGGRYVADLTAVERDKWVSLMRRA